MAISTRVSVELPDKCIVSPCQRPVCPLVVNNMHTASGTFTTTTGCLNRMFDRQVIEVPQSPSPSPVTVSFTILCRIGNTTIPASSVLKQDRRSKD